MLSKFSPKKSTLTGGQCAVPRAKLQEPRQSAHQGKSPRAHLGNNGLFTFLSHGNLL